MGPYITRLPEDADYALFNEYVADAGGELHVMSGLTRSAAGRLNRTFDTKQ